MKQIRKTRSRSLATQLALALSAFFVISNVLPSGASPAEKTTEASPYQKAVALYKGGKYQAAIGFFETAIRNNPNDAASHYYLALCFLALKQRGPARKEFVWVSRNCAEPNLKNAAEAAMNSIGEEPFSLNDGTVIKLEKKETRPKDLGRCKVIMFETTWCHYCHEFAPHFDETAAKNRRTMDFERVDAEKGRNIALARKYSIHSFPRLVYLDGKGNLLYNEGRANFDNRIQELSRK